MSFTISSIKIFLKASSSNYSTTPLLFKKIKKTARQTEVPSSEPETGSRTDSNKHQDSHPNALSVQNLRQQASIHHHADRGILISFHATLQTLRAQTHKYHRQYGKKLRSDRSSGRKEQMPQTTQQLKGCEKLKHGGRRRNKHGRRTT